MSSQQDATTGATTNDCPKIDVSSIVAKGLENAVKELARECIVKLANKFSFDAETEFQLLLGSPVKLNRRPIVRQKRNKTGTDTGTETATTNKTKQPRERKCPLPFIPSHVNPSGCQGLVFNRGLFTQCKRTPSSTTHFCENCQREINENDNKEPVCGTVQRRLQADLYKFVDNRNRKPTNYLKILERLKLTREQALQTAANHCVSIPEEHLVYPMPTTRKHKGIKTTTSSSTATATATAATAASTSTSTAAATTTTTTADEIEHEVTDHYTNMLAASLLRKQTNDDHSDLSDDEDDEDDDDEVEYDDEFDDEKHNGGCGCGCGEDEDEEHERTHRKKAVMCDDSDDDSNCGSDMDVDDDDDSSCDSYAEYKQTQKQREEEAAAAAAAEKKRQEEEAAAAAEKKRQEEEAAAAAEKKRQEEAAAAAAAKKKSERKRKATNVDGEDKPAKRNKNAAKSNSSVDDSESGTISMKKIKINDVEYFVRKDNNFILDSANYARVGTYDPVTSQATFM